MCIVTRVYLFNNKSARSSPLKRNYTMANDLTYAVQLDLKHLAGKEASDS